MRNIQEVGEPLQEKPEKIIKIYAVKT